MHVPDDVAVPISPIIYELKSSMSVVTVGPPNSTNLFLTCTKYQVYRVYIRKKYNIEWSEAYESPEFAARLLYV